VTPDEEAISLRAVIQEIVLAHHRRYGILRDDADRDLPLWIAYITYIRLHADFVYLAVAIDRYSRSQA
jgi:hypothetical protein